MSLWFVFALLSIAALTGAELSQKVSMSNKKDISAITNNFFVWTLQGIFGLILTAFLSDFTLPQNENIVWKFLLVGIVYFLGGTFYYTSYKANSASLSIVLGSFSVIVSTTLGILFLGEQLNLLKALGIIAVLIAIFIVNYSKGAKLSKYNYFALAGGFAFGLAFSIDKSFVIGNIYPTLYVGLLCLTVALISLLLGYKTIKNDVKGLVLADYKPMFLSAVFGTMFNTFTFFAYLNHGDVGKVDAMNNSVVFFVILFEVLLLKERTNLKKKLLAAAIAVLGIWSFTW